MVGEPRALAGQARVTLAHACAQALADRHDVDLLHVKGPALDPSLRTPGRTSSDADVLVRPAQVPALVAALRTADWRLVTGFRNGSAFEHAATYHHDAWGYLDLHRSFPGITRDAATAFEALWGVRGATDLAHRPCAVPAVLDQALLMCLHAARGFGDRRSRDDLELAWHRADADTRRGLRGRATELGAEVALAAATDDLDAHAGDRTVALWRYFSEGGSRADEWRARLRAAPTWRARVRIARRAVGVNREYAAMVRGHDLNALEVAQVFVTRFGRAAHLASRARPRSRPGSDR